MCSTKSYHTLAIAFLMNFLVVPLVHAQPYDYTWVRVYPQRFWVLFCGQVNNGDYTVGLGQQGYMMGNSYTSVHLAGSEALGRVSNSATFVLGYLFAPRIFQFGLGAGVGVSFSFSNSITGAQESYIAGIDVTAGLMLPVWGYLNIPVQVDGILGYNSMVRLQTGLAFGKFDDEY